MSKPGKLIKVALVISLSLNLLVVAALAGFFINGRHKDPRIGGGEYSERRGPMGSVLGRMLREMDQADRRALGRDVQQAIRDAGGLTRDVRRQMQLDLASALIARPFDIETVADIFAISQHDAGERIRITHQVLLQTLASMSDDERKKIAEAISRGSRRQRR